MRRTIASRMVQAAQSIPHFYLSMDVTLDALLALREQANVAAGNGAGSPPYKLSVNDFIIKAMALALRRVPAANAVWAETLLASPARMSPLRSRSENGLLTPVIRGAEAKTISAISSEMRYPRCSRARAQA